MNGAMTLCTRCSRPLSASDRACPYCGATVEPVAVIETAAEERRRISAGKIGGGPLGKAAVALAGLAAVAGSLAMVRGCSANAQDAPDATEAAAAAQMADAPRELTSAAISADVIANAQVALAQYNAGPMAISGTVKSIETVTGGTLRVGLRGMNDATEVAALIDAKPSERDPMLIRGLTVTLTCKAMTIRGALPILQHCRV